MHSVLYKAVGVLILPFYLVISVQLIDAAMREIQLMDSCGKHKTQNMTDVISYVVKWDGKALPASVCQHGFTGHTDIYTVCFEVLSYQVGDCGIQLVYSETPGSNIANYTCDMFPGPWCATPGSVAHIELHGADTAPVNTTGFQIMVRATSEDKNFYLKLGVVIGIVAVIGTVFGAILCCIRKRSEKAADIRPTGYTRFDD